MAEDIAKDLGDLICELNPYTDVPDQTGKTGGTGDMDIYVDNPNKPPAPGKDRDTPADPCQMEVEVDDEYAGEWTFKGEAQHIAKAVRIKYRYPILDPTTKKPVRWIDDYLLVGYEGSGH